MPASQNVGTTRTPLKIQHIRTFLTGILFSIMVIGFFVGARLILRDLLSPQVVDPLSIAESTLQMIGMFFCYVLSGYSLYCAVVDLRYSLSVNVSKKLSHFVYIGASFNKIFAIFAAVGVVFQVLIMILSGFDGFSASDAVYPVLFILFFLGFYLPSKDLKEVSKTNI